MLRGARSRVAIARARRRAVILAGAGAAVLLLSSSALAGALPVVSTGAAAPEKITTLPRMLSGSATTSADPKPAQPVEPLPPPTRTSCRSVVYIGDSTSRGQTSTSYIPQRRKRLRGQLWRVGVKFVYPEISGARSIVETYQGAPNAATVARNHISGGFDGCWVLALGTNDVANATLSSVGQAARIRTMMKILGDRPVMWVAAITLLRSGPYAEAGMQHWNRALVTACKRHPNMRVYDWPARAKRKWFVPDGTHYYSPGYIARNRGIAHGLVHAFPRHRPPSAGCLVR
jgi:hypothetical protein